MIKIAEAFRNKKAFIAYLMAGDPDLKTSAELILTAQEAGADLIEIGIPFSDPIAEGEVIQAASVRALQAGTRLDGVFDMVASIKDKMYVPMVFMTYANPVFVYGYDRFFAKCAEIGICGIIIPDMPFEEQAEAKRPARKHGIEVVTLVAPTSSEGRIRNIAAAAEGFVYVVSSMGVTGVRSDITTDLPAIVSKIKENAKVPVAIGFGISTPEQAEEFSRFADGVIVGSAIVRIIAQHGTKAKPALYKYVSGMKRAL
ncbi:tryptophan synthase alpha chain [Candidatus Methanoplasma termitum]|uniref:Tryptophan synthase alpha chain n=1 Tax=Candidatus Methanoplasma termitum TaxID=1577791 RepID=A0A0A7L9Y1_9ARCH|nr:tryptophan synthase subunit alpha [Candidatus Methanoplasma termitum]AIZ55960.1 tryptophan synthase alpha chain [Candidatus Methanoplasma termitum]MCL2334428.1 tryptophan synthase subunit alpha [Candidatus Methanoplasma sp.]